MPLMRAPPYLLKALPPNTITVGIMFGHTNLVRGAGEWEHRHLQQQPEQRLEWRTLKMEEGALRVPLEAGKGKEMDCPLEPPEGASPPDTLTLAPGD